MQIINIHDEVKKHHPHLIEKWESRQYKLSEEFVKRKLELSVNQKTMSELMELTFNEYLIMEWGSLEHSVDDYERALNTLEKNVSKSKQL